MSLSAFAAPVLLLFRQPWSPNLKICLPPSPSVTLVACVGPLSMYNSYFGKFSGLSNPNNVKQQKTSPRLLDTTKLQCIAQILRNLSLS